LTQLMDLLQTTQSLNDLVEIIAILSGLTPRTLQCPTLLDHIEQTIPSDFRQVSWADGLTSKRLKDEQLKNILVENRVNMGLEGIQRKGPC